MHDERFYGEFECPKCINMWSSGFCWKGFSQFCILCPNPPQSAYPTFLNYITKEIYYGEFDCACGKKWGVNLKQFDDNYSQRCRTCHQEVYIYYPPIRPTYKKHKQKYCGKCISLGENCVHFYKKKRPTF